MPDGPNVILTLKILVTLVTVLFAAAVAAIALGYRKWHGRLNAAFFVLTMATIVSFETRLRFGPGITEQFSPEVRQALRVHLAFAVPSLVLLPVMYWSGLTRRRKLHLPLATLFTVLWAGTFVTGVFFLPHD